NVRTSSMKLFSLPDDPGIPGKGWSVGKLAVAPPELIQSMTPGTAKVLPCAAPEISATFGPANPASTASEKLMLAGRFTCTVGGSVTGRVSTWYTLTLNPGFVASSDPTGLLKVEEMVR